MSIYNIEIKDKNKKLEYYETVFPRLNEFYENNYKTVEINRDKANKYDSLVEKIKQIRDKLEVEDYYCSREALEDLNKILNKEGE